MLFQKMMCYIESTFFLCSFEVSYAEILCRHQFKTAPHGKEVQRRTLDTDLIAASDLTIQVVSVF